MLKLLPLPYDFISSICQDGREAIIKAYLDLKAEIQKVYNLSDADQYAAAGLIFTLNLAFKDFPNDDSTGCYDLMREEGLPSLPDIMWEILSVPVSTAVYLRFVENRVDSYLKPYRIELV